MGSLFIYIERRCGGGGVGGSAGGGTGLEGGGG